MSASFYDLLKYAATGQASPSMTYYDKMRASTLMGGGTVQTLTGIPPLSFKSDGTPLISWSMKGNGSQSGTPSPDNIIMPTFCGVRTANVMPAGEKKTVTIRGITFESDGNGRYHVYGTSTGSASAQFNLAYGFTTPISISNGGQGTLSIFNDGDNANVVIAFYNGTEKVDDWRSTPKNRTSTAYNAIGNKYIDVVRITVASGETVDMIISPEFTNDGVLPSGFEPFGWAEKITCAGQTTPVYLGQVSTVRRLKKLVLTGNEDFHADTVDENRSVFWLALADCAGNFGFCSHIDWKSAYQPTEYDRIVWVKQVRRVFISISNNYISAQTVQAFREYITSQYANGTPFTLWYVLSAPETRIVNEPLCKIGDYADELSSANAAVTIPTVKGSNTLTVDTDLQPSEMTITFKG